MPICNCANVNRKELCQFDSDARYVDSLCQVLTFIHHTILCAVRTVLWRAVLTIYVPLKIPHSGSRLQVAAMQRMTLVTEKTIVVYSKF